MSIQKTPFISMGRLEFKFSVGGVDRHQNKDDTVNVRFRMRKTKNFRMLAKPMKMNGWFDPGGRDTRDSRGPRAEKSFSALAAFQHLQRKC